MVFSESDLIDYVQSPSIPPEAMAQLNKLLFKELREYCDICEDDRMTCVLSPMCPKRVLLKVRIESGAKIEDIIATANKVEPDLTYIMKTVVEKLWSSLNLKQS